MTTIPPRTNNALKWKIKRATNDQLRKKFIDKTIPQAEFIGLEVPDPEAQLQEDGSYKTGEINWDEFYNVIKGNGPLQYPKDESPHQISQRRKVGTQSRIGTFKKN